MDGEKEAKQANYPETQIDVLEDRENVQITLKQIRELVAGGKGNSRDAAVLLRATQIAGAILKPEEDGAACERKVGPGSRR